LDQEMLWRGLREFGHLMKHWNILESLRSRVCFESKSRQMVRISHFLGGFMLLMKVRIWLLLVTFHKQHPYFFDSFDEVDWIDANWQHHFGFSSFRVRQRTTLKFPGKNFDWSIPCAKIAKKSK
jgi:hypothetical protein